MAEKGGQDRRAFGQRGQGQGTTTPPGKSFAAPAASNASRVLPMPPVPASVRSRAIFSASTIAAVSASRPIRRVSGAGRRRGAAEEAAAGRRPRVRVLAPPVHGKGRTFPGAGSAFTSRRRYRRKSRYASVMAASSPRRASNRHQVAQGRFAQGVGGKQALQPRQRGAGIAFRRLVRQFFQQVKIRLFPPPPLFAQDVRVAARQQFPADTAPPPAFPMLPFSPPNRAGVEGRSTVYARPGQIEAQDTRGRGKQAPRFRAEGMAQIRQIAAQIVPRLRFRTVGPQRKGQPFAVNLRHRGARPAGRKAPAPAANAAAALGSPFNSDLKRSKQANFQRRRSSAFVFHFHQAGGFLPRHGANRSVKYVTLPYHSTQNLAVFPAARTRFRQRLRLIIEKISIMTWTAQFAAPDFELLEKQTCMNAIAAAGTERLPLLERPASGPVCARLRASFARAAADELSGPPCQTRWNARSRRNLHRDPQPVGRDDPAAVNRPSLDGNRNGHGITESFAAVLGNTTALTDSVFSAPCMA